MEAPSRSLRIKLYYNIGYNTILSLLVVYYNHYTLLIHCAIREIGFVFCRWANNYDMGLLFIRLQLFQLERHGRFSEFIAKRLAKIQDIPKNVGCRYLTFIGLAERTGCSSLL